MELCKKVQAEETDIHVERATNFYTHLQFSLLASTWFPHPLGVCLWSVLHVLLVFYEALMLIGLFSIVFMLTVLWDAVLVVSMICTVLFLPFTFIVFFLVQGIAIAVVWLWLVVSCQCCTIPGRAPGQGLGHYVCTAGGILEPQQEEPQLAPVVEGGGAGFGGPCGLLKALCLNFYTVRLVSHVTQLSFPYWREKLGDLCREIVPRYDTLVM